MGCVPRCPLPATYNIAGKQMLQGPQLLNLILERNIAKGGLALLA